MSLSQHRQQPAADEIILRAPAKLNLNLRIAGKAEDGYHQLVSLVGFTAFGDSLQLRPSDQDKITIDGPQSRALSEAGGDSLIARAREGLRDLGADIPPTAIHMTKEIPIGGGLGGGSTDAAAALRGLMQLYDIALDPQALHHLARSLGADVPVCLHPGWQIMGGIGEQLYPLMQPETPLFITLANPGRHVATAAIFAALNAPFVGADAIAKTDSNLRAEITRLYDQPRHPDWAGLVGLGNDLTLAASALCPEIARLLADMERLSSSDLAASAPALAIAMSGSGASCFALFSEQESADALAKALQIEGYWAVASAFL